MISVKNLKKTYLLGGEEVHALDDVSLSIKEHEFVAIIGQSGSGKSTFMNMLGCLDRPDSGEITLDGTDILKCKEKELSVIYIPFTTAQRIMQNSTISSFYVSAVNEGMLNMAESAVDSFLLEKQEMRILIRSQTSPISQTASATLQTP